MVLSPTTLLIGCSERTSPQTVERLAHEALFPAHPELSNIYVVLMPEGRSVMHLDTILTHLDAKVFLGHRPLISGQGDQKPAPIARLTRDCAPELVERATTLDVLREELGRDVELVPCGGEDPLYQEREQWTDGANAVCLAPGRILLYSRNVRTIGALGRSGFEEVRLSVVQPHEQRAELIADGMKKPRVVFSFSGSELSRARGGGRCLTMPLERD
jgi:arginine deiminase